MRGMRKKALEVIALWLLVAELCMAGCADNAYQRKRGDPALYGTMDENGVFWISTAKDLGWFLRYVREGHEELCGALSRDIDLEGKSCFGNVYRGHFDGNGHTISGGVCELMMILEAGARIENLNVENISVTDDQHGCGGLVYRNYGEIINCRVSGYVEGADYTGGIAAVNYGRIEGCVNRADVVSTKTDVAYGFSGDQEGGAGGIAGYSGTAKRKEEPTRVPVVADCVNQGNVTAQTIAGGICAVVDDRTGEKAPNNSVQEMVEEFGYSLAEDDGQTETGQDAKETEAGRHFSVRSCKNEGSVTVMQIADCYGGSTKAGGICGILHQGDLYRCANLGTVRISEDTPDQAETGRAYVNRPMAITYNMGFAQSEKQHIVDCVSLKGTVAQTMRHESVMELTEEELPLWEAGKLPYVSNNWKFDLEQAAHDCSLEPLGITEHALSQKKENYYLCDAFALKLPEGFAVTEEFVDGTCYALRIQWKEGADCSDYEVWVLRKEADIDTALRKVRESNTLPEWRVEYFAEEVFATLPNEHIFGIDSLNLPGHKCYRKKTVFGHRIYLEDGIPALWLPKFMQEGNHVLGNLIAIPLETDGEGGLSAKWILVFTNGTNNIRPSDDYIELVEGGFYPLTGTERLITVQPGDTLWEFAERYTGDGGNWRMLAEMNGIEEKDGLFAGSRLLVPDKDVWAKTPLDLAFDKQGGIQYTVDTH
ncbi:MAG: LysM peptidoglycan-binding domain-containing protein [Lachnospiraceae bacterium]|nr:LysM peptidoglycan-binding domain-containing protein [Lachnospiraceae bacterium]